MTRTHAIRSDVKVRRGRAMTSAPSYDPPGARRFDEHGLSVADSASLMEPLGHIDFIALQRNASLVLTDSGGVQEETTVLGVPCVTIRSNTEGPVTVEVGTNILAKPVRAEILRAAMKQLSDPKTGRVPELWDGKAGERVAEALLNR